MLGAMVMTCGSARKKTPKNKIKKCRKNEEELKERGKN
jgi:hypothetical protein